MEKLIEKNSYQSEEWTNEYYNFNVKSHASALKQGRDFRDSFLHSKFLR